MNGRVRTFCALLTTSTGVTAHARLVRKPAFADPPLRADAEVVRELTALDQLLARIPAAAARLDHVVGRIRTGGEIPSSDAPLPMAETDFTRLLAVLDADALAQRRLATLRDAARNNRLTVDQLRQVVERFAFPAERVEAVRAVAPRRFDPEHGDEFFAAFLFEDDRAEVRQTLGNTARPAP